MCPSHVASRLSVRVAAILFVLGFALSMAASAQAALTYEQIILADNPTAYWRFEEASTALPAADTATADGAQNGTYVGSGVGAVSLGPGKVGQAVDVAPLDPVGGYVEASGVNIAASFTVEAWAQSALPNWNAFGWLPNSRDANGFILHPNPGGTSWNAYVLNNTPGGYTQIGTQTPPANVSIQDWHHYVLTYDAATTIGRMYFDGALVASKTGITGVRDATGTINVLIGRDSAGTTADRRGDGALDEVAIYQSTLSPDQVASHYYSTTGARAFSGPGDLDLSGDFQYAVNVGNTSAGTVGTIRDATFTGEGVGGVLVQSENIIYPAWGPKPEYGDSAEDNLLEDIMHSIRYDSAGNAAQPGVQIALDVTPGQSYKLQLLISENGYTNRGNRSFNVKVDNGTNGWDTLLANLDPLGPTGPWSGQPTRGTVFTYGFIARGDTFKVLLDPGMMFDNHDAILSAFTLERVPEPSSLVILGMGGALLGLAGCRRRRKSSRQT